jgi:hypothetical protein
MWWVPLTTAVALGLLVFGLHFWHQRRQRGEAKSYRARFIQLVAQLETVTNSVNQLALQLRQVREPKLLDYYESTLRLLETLLAAVRKIPPFGSDPATLDSHQAFQDAVRGRPVKLDDLYGATGAPKKQPSSGCYFCSRPVIASRFSQVKVRIDGVVKEVLSCKVCKEELESTKKVKVLYFMKDGKPVHWSEVADYSPSEDFWNINKRDTVQKTRRLELVHTQPDQKPTE